MDRVIVDAHVDEQGEVKLTIPAGLKIAPGDYKVEFNGAEAEFDEAPWTEEELKKAIQSHPVPADQMITGGWEDLGIEDSQAWVEALRRKAQEDRAWSTRS